jgi:S1-C subfamily serine protease
MFVQASGEDQMNQSQWALAALASAWLFGSAAQAADDDHGSRSIEVTKFLSSIPAGTPWGSVQVGLLCATKMKLLWGVKGRTITLANLPQPARDELRREGYNVARDPTAPFSRAENADLQMAGTITDASARFCERISLTRAEGNVLLSVKWTVYSKIQRSVVYEIQTRAAFKSDGQSNSLQMIEGAVTENVKQLAALAEFKALMSVPKSKPAPELVQQPKDALGLTGSRQAKDMKISDAVGSVVLILSGGGHGSGFLVSSEGYLMTAQHVVGTDKYVKVRWSDGLEGVGEVIRTDKRRDVALIKTDPRGRSPLGLHLSMPEPGDTTFAIGAPLDLKFQNTVTRGVASSNRIIDGFNFIQSDVTINPGNSGGPLLNEKGEVLGIADLAFRERGDTPTGINFFVPIRDALDFLSLEQR